MYVSRFVFILSVQIGNWSMESKGGWKFFRGASGSGNNAENKVEDYTKKILTVAIKKVSAA